MKGGWQSNYFISEKGIEEKKKIKGEELQENWEKRIKVEGEEEAINRGSKKIRVELKYYSVPI